MEIIATHTDIAGKIAVLIFFGLIALLFWVFAWVDGDAFYFFGAIVVSVFVLMILCADVNTYYDAIVTDWNAVYDQGYEIVEQNGKIITLRKAGD